MTTANPTEMTEAELQDRAARAAHLQAAVQAEADAAAAELARRAQERAAALEARRRDWDASTVRQWSSREQHLRDIAKVQSRAFDNAAERGDLQGAITAWLTERATLQAIDRVRTSAWSAEQRAKTGLRVNDAPLRHRPSDFLERFGLALDAAATRLGERMASELIGSRPGDDGGTM